MRAETNYRGRVSSTRRPSPEPLEANDQVVAGVITGGWVIALIVLLAVRTDIPASDRWWIWTCVTGVGLGLFGLLYAGFGMGALAGSLVAAAAGDPTWERLEWAIVGFGGCVAAIAPLDSIPAVLVLLFATGLCSSLWTTTSQSILQLSAPDHLRGRVLSLYWFVFAGLTPLGSILIGVLAAVGGTRLVFGVAGLVALAAAGYLFWRIRATAATFPSCSYNARAWATDASVSAASPAAR